MLLPFSRKKQQSFAHRKKIRYPCAAKPFDFATNPPARKEMQQVAGVGEQWNRKPV
jgi:hypothetical protein